jgi:hypothetical protein
MSLALLIVFKIESVVVVIGIVVVVVVISIVAVTVRNVIDMVAAIVGNMN